MKDKIKINENKVFNLVDEASNFPHYLSFSPVMRYSKLFKSLREYDLKRIEIFKEKFDLEKFKQRSKKYIKLEDYWLKKFDENFIDFIENLKKYLKIPYEEIPKDYPIGMSNLIDNPVIGFLYLSFAITTQRGPYSFCFDKYFDRFNFNYDTIDIKAIKGEIDEDVREVFRFSTDLVANLEGTVPIDIAENLLKYFRGGRQLKVSQKTKYKLVAEYITIIEKHFKISTGIQRIACELAGVIQYSFSAWKNAKNKAGEKKNFDTYQKWTKEKIPSKKVEELKTDVANYIKST